ncbi:MAG: chorion class high-cysteine HCB protein 13 [Lachnospiraceae bacterium]|nr:chorion class high-cysteine HCB protein 13 [Lachnospiraceae bacterium]
MSDLAATTCGGCNGNDNGCNWIIILLLLCCCGGNGGFGFGNSCGDNGCSSIIWIILILCCCCGGGNGGFF